MSTDSKLDVFSGQLQYTLQRHKRTSSDSELTVKEAFTYSAQNRLLTHTHQINGGVEQLLADNSYDELGKLTSKKVGNTSALPLQNVNYTYNVRGWLTKINEIGSLQQGTDPADLFGFKINYNTVDGNVNAANKLYNGNIAETFWSTATDGGFVRNYGYKYDQLNRLKDASYGKSSLVTHMYDENLTYDKNGNILTLKRNGDRDVQAGIIGIDDLVYTYAISSNKLLSATDTPVTATSGFKDGNATGDDYVYDSNGNMTMDKNKNITSITYNHLNLPTKIIFPTGNIVYIYTASGQKMQKIVTDGTNTTTTDYLGGYQYQNTVLQYFPTAEGYVKNTPVSGTNTYNYVFNYTDHIGNTRLSYTKDTTTGSLKILEENNFYPFGLKHSPYNAIAPAPEYKYKFNGKELQDENIGGNQLNLYDFGARNYDPALGRWMNIDPLARTSRRWNPYTYCYSNPLRFTDPDGMLSFDNMNPNQNETEMRPEDWIVHLNSEGKTAVTYQEDIKTKEQAEAAGYKGVSQVVKSGTLSGSASDGINYSYKLNANGTVTNSQGQTTNQGFATPQGTWVSENPIGRYNMFFNGAKNTILGVAGTLGAIAAAPETGGASAVALTLTTSATGIGFGQMLNAFQKNVDSDLQNFSTLPGLGAARAGSQYAPLIDGVSNWATGSLSDPRMLGNTIGTYRSLQGLSKGNNVFLNATSVYGTYDSGKNLYDGIKTPKR